MSDEVKPTLEDLTECWCGYKAPHARELMLHQLYCDPHNTAPKVIDDQRERIADLEAQLAAAQAEQAEITRLREGGCAREQGATQYCAEAQRLAGDAAILDWIADSGFIETVMGGEINVHEEAMRIAVDAEPTVEDYRLALRQMVRAAMDEELN